MKTLFKRLRNRTRSWIAERRIEKKTTYLLDLWISKKGYLKRQSLSEAAEEIGVSEYQLRYYFLTVIKKPFLTWRKEKRIIESLEIMKKNPEAKLFAVAMDVGIEDLRNFRRQFEETLHISLSKWRKSLRKNK